MNVFRRGFAALSALFGAPAKAAYSIFDGARPTYYPPDHPKGRSFFGRSSRRFTGKPSILARIESARTEDEVQSVLAEARKYDQVSTGTIGKWYRAVAEKSFDDGYLDPQISGGGKLSATFHHLI